MGQFTKANAEFVHDAGVLQMRIVVFALEFFSFAPKTAVFDVYCLHE